MSVPEFEGAASGGSNFAREAAFDPAPRRLHRVCTFARELGRMGVPEADALEEIEDAIFANGLLPSDRASRSRAWRVGLDAAQAAFAQGAREATFAMALVALAEANGDPIAAVRPLMARALLLADDEDVADALGLVWASDFITAVRKAIATGEAEWIARAEDEEAALRFELTGWAELKAERAARALFADVAGEAELVEALMAAHPLITAEIAADVAARAIARHAQPPQRQYETDGAMLFSGDWQEPEDTAMAVHGKAASMLDRHREDPTLVEFDPNAAMLALELRAQEAGTPEAHALATSLKRERLGMNAPVEIDEPEPEELSIEHGLADLCSPPGLVGEIMDWMEASSDRPNRALLLGAALTFVGTLAGRKFATPSNLRSNSYVVTLAPSGHGKDHALQQIKTLSAAAGLDRYVGPARIMSASALRKLVAREPAVACYMDEFGGFMGQIHDRRAGLHNAMIRYDMLEMFSAAGTFFAGAEYAGEQATKVFAPNLSISGTSTPEAFWSSLSSLSASDGLLARLILFDVTGPKPARVKPRLAPSEVPAGLIDAVRALAGAGGNLASITSDRAPSTATVPLDAEAEAIDALRIAEFDAAEGSISAEAMPFLNRVREHALKLALVVAVGCNFSAPIITGPVLDWAYHLARLSAATLIRESTDRIADNERAAAYGKILLVIKGAGAAGIQPSKIGDRLKGIDRRLREELLSDMAAAGRVQLVKKAPAGGRGGRASERYFAT